MEHVTSFLVNTNWFYSQDTLWDAFQPSAHILDMVDMCGGTWIASDRRVLIHRFPRREQEINSSSSSDHHCYHSFVYAASPRELLEDPGEVDPVQFAYSCVKDLLKRLFVYSMCEDESDMTDHMLNIFVSGAEEIWVVVDVPEQVWHKRLGGLAAKPVDQKIVVDREQSPVRQRRYSEEDDPPLFPVNEGPFFAKDVDRDSTPPPSSDEEDLF